MSQLNQNSNANQLGLQLAHSTVVSSACAGRPNAVKRWLKDVAPESVEHSLLPVEQFGYQLVGGKSARESEFQAGRFCAQQALSRWVQDSPVKKADDRSPIWPDRFSGSISHSKNWVWAAVAETQQVRSIGIDTEPIVDSATRSQAWEQTATLAELRTLEALELDPGAEFTVLFSAKEAFYKCCYPIVKQYFDFKDAVVESCQPGQLTIRPVAESAICQTFSSSLIVHYFVDATDVFTVTWMTNEN